MMKIQVYGPGFSKCQETERLVQKTAADKTFIAEIEKVTEFNAITQLGVFTTPAVIENGVVKCIGKVPSRA